MADEKIISVRLRALTSDLESGMRRAGASVRGFQAAADRDMQALGNTLRNAGRSMTMGLTVPIAAGFALALQQSISFESAMAEVAKTLGLSASQTEEMAAGIRAMAMELPATREEIAAVAAAAGQLGIQRENVLEFTRTMIAFGVSTNMAAEDAAQALARFANITQMPQTEFDNLASSVVDLGNAGASTESDIVNMGLRLAAAGSQAGLTEGQIMGLAAALSDVGLSAELGGSNFSRVIMRMRDAAIQGGEALDAFAAAAGMSAHAFADLFQRDPAEAIARFVEGLHGIVQAGGSVTPILQGIGLRGSELADVLGRVSNAGDNVAESMRRGEDAFQQNSALMEEAARRYETTGSQMQIAWNRITDAAMTAGDIIAPIAASIAGGIADMAQSFGDLPGPVQSVLIALAGLVAVAGPLLVIAGSLINAWALVGPALASAGAALTTFLATQPELAAMVLTVTAVAAAFALFGDSNDDMEAQREHIEELTNAARTLGQTLAQSGPDAFLVDVMHQLLEISPEVVDALTDAGISISDLVEMIASGMSVSGEGELFDQIIDQMGLTGDEADALRSRLADLAYQISIALGASDAEARAAALEATSDGLQGVGGAAEDAAGGIQTLNQEIDEYLGQTQGLEAARDALQGAFADLRQSLIDNGSAWQGHSDAARANRDAGREVVDTFAQVVEQLDATGAGANQFARAGQNAIDELRQLNADGLLTDGQLAVLEGRIRGFPELHLNADGSQARGELQRTLAEMTPFERRQFLAYLRGDGSQARQEAGTTSDHINQALSRQFRAFLRADGNPARSEAQRTAQALIAATNRRYEALLRANNIQALQEIEEARRAARAMADANYTAHINIVTTNNADVPGLTHAAGGYIRHRPGGRLVLAGEGGYDEATITSDPRYRARQLALLARLGFGQFSQPYSGLGTGATVGGGGTRVEYNFVVVRDTREAVAAVPSARREHARAFLDGRAG